MEVRVAATTTTAFGHHKGLTIFNEVCHELARFFVTHRSPQRNRHDHSVAAATVFIAALAVFTGLAFKLSFISEINERIDVSVCLKYDVRSFTAVAAVRPAVRNILFASETTHPVAAVTGYFHRFLARWPTVADLAAAPDAEVMAEWAGLGYYARARNLLKGARAVAASESAAFPDRYDDLIALPGIGPYTAAAIAAIAFGRPETVVDGNVERVVARLFAVTEPLPKAGGRLRHLAASLTPDKRPGDFAQAMMDLGATVCTPRKPACMICPLGPHCQARALGIAADLPVKAPKPAKPERQGLAYVARRADGALLLETRPERGLLGGTLGFPTTGWTVAPPDPAPPFRADWRQLPGTVRHTFTHFHLTLIVLTADAPPGANPDRGSFRAPPDAPPRKPSDPDAQGPRPRLPQRKP